MKLFHISDNSNIEIFTPQEVKKEVWPQLKNSYVWAISEEMIHNYYFPRDCPRVCWTIGPSTTETERKQFFEFGNQKAIIILEKRWKDKIENAHIFQYEFSSTNFFPIDYDAGYYISENSERPISKIKLNNLLEMQNQNNIKIEYRNEIVSLSKKIAKSNYRFSNIKMANAKT